MTQEITDTVDANEGAVGTKTAEPKPSNGNGAAEAASAAEPSAMSDIELMKAQLEALKAELEETKATIRASMAPPPPPAAPEPEDEPEPAAKVEAKPEEAKPEPAAAHEAEPEAARVLRPSAPPPPPVRPKSLPPPLPATSAVDADDAEPVSLRDVEVAAPSSRDRELEPVSLRDIEMILAPGKQPPALADEAPAAKPPPPGTPRKRLPSLLTVPAKAKEAPTVSRGEDSALEDLRALAGLGPEQKKVDFDEIMHMGTATAMDARLSQPEIARTSVLPEEPRAAKGPPRPPLKKRDAEPAAEAEEPAQTPAPTSAKGRPAAVKKKRRGAVSIAPSADETGADFETTAPPPAVTDEEVAPPSTPATATKPKAKPSVSKATPTAIATEKTRASAAAATEETSSKAPIYLGLVAALAIGGYFALRGPTDAPAAATGSPRTTAAQVSTAAAESTATSAPTGASDLAAAPPDTAPPEDTTAPVASAAPVLSGRLATATSTTATAEPTSTATATAATTASAAPTTTAAPTASAAPTTDGADGPEFDKAAASAALGQGVAAASGCKQEGDPSGMARVQVTFAPSGRVTSAVIAGPPFAGTATGSCIARAFKSVTVPPFSGAPVTVQKSVGIP